MIPDERLAEIKQALANGAAAYIVAGRELLTALEKAQRAVKSLQEESDGYFRERNTAERRVEALEKLLKRATSLIEYILTAVDGEYLAPLAWPEDAKVLVAESQAALRGGETG